ncbi:unnamed protein product [Vitrella brassicaformis CCMP3155]|uniref:Uncharacterized protein n=2 Tax=Vitrella brassicaformis TaxID=1169539 RepID=A0A0G4GSD4_VITBC|nr:unnamed protein product [Vitrella brassicaformis CCMP3155]|eukprot:CEM33336.1 unnamed protein product [Vitrella brassicaformis CCMP3155]
MRRGSKTTRSSDGSGGLLGFRMAPETPRSIDREGRRASGSSARGTPRVQRLDQCGVSDVSCDNTPASAQQRDIVTTAMPAAAKTGGDSGTDTEGKPEGKRLHVLTDTREGLPLSLLNDLEHANKPHERESILLRYAMQVKRDLIMAREECGREIACAEVARGLLRETDEEKHQLETKLDTLQRSIAVLRGEQKLQQESDSSGATSTLIHTPKAEDIITVGAVQFGDMLPPRATSTDHGSAWSDRSHFSPQVPPPAKLTDREKRVSVDSTHTGGGNVSVESDVDPWVSIVERAFRRYREIWTETGAVAEQECVLLYSIPRRGRNGEVNNQWFECTLAYQPYNRPGMWSEKTFEFLLQDPVNGDFLFRVTLPKTEVPCMFFVKDPVSNASDHPNMAHDQFYNLVNISLSSLRDGEILDGDRLSNIGIAIRFDGWEDEQDGDTPTGWQEVRTHRPKPTRHWLHFLDETDGSWKELPFVDRTALLLNARAVTFVIRNHDGSRWLNGPDGTNFRIGFPGAFVIYPDGNLIECSLANAIPSEIVDSNVTPSPSGRPACRAPDCYSIATPYGTPHPSEPPVDYWYVVDQDEQVHVANHDPQSDGDSSDPTPQWVPDPSAGPSPTYTSRLRQLERYDKRAGEPDQLGTPSDYHTPRDFPSHGDKWGGGDQHQFYPQEGGFVQGS